jgi:murein DD-endopeptidase MepM/ murein hydrolase activator NlpD
VLRVSLTRRPALAAVLAIGLLAASTLTDRAGAQDAPSPSVPDPSVTVPELTETPVGELPPDATVPLETTAPAEAPTTAPNRHEEVGPATTTTLAGATTAVPDTTAVAPVDGVVEGETEAVPVVAPALVDLPVRGRGAARTVAGVPARVNALVKEARDANAEMLVRLDEAAAANLVTAAAVASAQERMDHLSAKQRSTAAELAVARQMFEERVRWAYTRGPTATLEGFLQSKDAAQLADRRAMVQFVLQEDADAVNDYISLRASVDASVTTADDFLSSAQRAHATTQIAEDAARDDVALTTLTVGMWQRAIKGLRDLVFPVVGPHAFGSDFGAPRMVGSPDEHTHEGNDIAAPLGAALVAVEPGMVVAMGTDRLGGIKLWLAGRSGTYYYYAHLSKFADDVHEGDIVPAGTIVGYCGNTGNARGGIPHLHFEVHPNGGPAVDPYPFLAAADRRQKLAKWP